MGYILWGYKGSGDHGWEDWLRGLCRLLPQKPDVYSQCPQEDLKYGLGELCGLFSTQDAPCGLRPGDWWVDVAPRDRPKGLGKGVNRMLFGWWGDIPTGQTVRQLRRYDAVVVTERRSLGRLKHAGLGDRLQLRPEPGFLVAPAQRAAAIPIPPNTLGLSLSYPPEAQPVLYESYCRLIEWILRETEYSIALIPFCVRQGENDLLLQQVLYRRFRTSGRVYLRKDGSSPLLKGDLAQCRCCIGFWGAVAAWSCGVPALCLLGAEKALGLSHDIWGSSYESVCPWQTLQDENTLTHRFIRFLETQQENQTRLHRYQAVGIF